MNKKNSISIANKIENSKIDIVRMSLRFVLIPIIILLVGVILFATVGFTQGIDFTGGYTFKIYVNNEAKLENATVYDLDERKDYDEVYKKISLILEENNVNLVSYQTAKVNLPEYDVYDGVAVSVTYQTNEHSKEPSEIRGKLVDVFGYSEYDTAVSIVEEVYAVESFNWMIVLVATVLFGLISAIIYMSIRYSKSAIFVMFIQVALDVFLTLGLMLIFRVTVNLSVGIIVLSAFFVSMINSFIFYNKIKENRKSGLCENKTNTEIANKATKQIAYKKFVAYICAIVVALVFIILSVSAVRAVAVGILLMLVATFYTSTFLLPTFWSVVDKEKKNKKKI